ncbi:MAG: glycosyltransferase family 4 protein [Bacteroidetes bacterium]|nr:glycosyltransferase family 4 protein [Bacteroidota bacterium]
MRIAFDAKRALHNSTGLGHYSRTLISTLASTFPQNEHFLVNPKLSSLFSIKGHNLHELRPPAWYPGFLSSLWRTKSCVTQLAKQGVQLYHGLSHEIPFGLKKKGIASVVTMHDLIFERYPKQYQWADRKIYRAKFKHAIKNTDLIIAISEQTKRDLIEFYQADPAKIRVCYQSCNPAFAQQIEEAEKERIRTKYNLPHRFLLSVGSIIERKNLLAVCQAMALQSKEDRLPLVVVGNGGAYKKKVKTYLAQVGLANQVIFLSDNPANKKDPSFLTALDLPGIYQNAAGLLYPSTFEGFGIPVLEGLFSRIPVITSNQSCLPEAGGSGAFYVNPYIPEQIAEQLHLIVNNKGVVEKKIEAGWQHAQHFTPLKTACTVMQVYTELINQ